MKRQLVVGLFVFGLVTTGCLVCAERVGTELNKQSLSNARNNPKAIVIADGNPAPPFPPIKKPKVVLVAAPRQSTTPDWLTADGNPAPPFPPSPKVPGGARGADLSPKLTADGNPAPPFPPRPPTQMPLGATV